jgi:hypothetical protein
MRRKLQFLSSVFCHLSSGIWPLFGVAILSMSGCSGCNPIPTTTGKPADGDDEEILREARELYRKAADAPSFRLANARVNDYLNKRPAALAKYQPASGDAAKWQNLLETVVGLDQAEIAETESGTFKLLDGSYLESCYLLRSAANAMHLEKLPPLDQAEYCWRWVIRQIVLHETQGELLPPQFVLRRGSGNAAERALVFLSLIKHLNLDGCILAVPGDGTIRPWLVGVLVENKGQRQVYLFDPRLGLPVRKGEGIATLEELRKDPTLLDVFKVEGDTYDVDAKQTAAAEIQVMMPLSALSARMQFLEQVVLLNYDRINLAVRPAELIAKFEALQAGPVRVWNAPVAKGYAAPASPTRAWRQFLPPDEGGIDTSKPKRLDRFNAQLVPMASIMHGYVELKVSPVDLPIQDAQDRLGGMALQLWSKFAETPHQQIVRGRLDDFTKRLAYMQNKLERVQEPDEELRKQIEEWKDRVKAVYKNGNPNRILEIWVEDQWINVMANNPDEEIGNRNPLPRKLLSYIILRALVEPLRSEVDYLLAVRCHEKAERLQVKIRQLKVGGAQPGKAGDDLKEAWTTAVDSWDTYGYGDIFTPDSLKERAAAVEKLSDTIKSKQLAADLLGYQAALFRQAASARLQFAQSLVQNDKAQARVVLEKLVADLSAFLSKNKEEWEKPRGMLVNGASAELQAQVEKIYADLGPQGSLVWIRYSAKLQLQRSKG